MTPQSLIHFGKKCRRALSIALLVCVAWFLALPRAVAEGSSNLTSNGGNRAYTEYRNDNTLNSNLRRRTIVHVYVNSGEILYLGSSAKGVGSGAINWRAPDGTSGTFTGGGNGVITNRTQEVAGPLPNVGGYNPSTLTAGAGQTGVWEIHFISPDPTSATNPPSIGAAAAWAQAAGVGYITAWDVTVRTGGGTAISGRVFLHQFAGNMGANGVQFNGIFRVLTVDGYRYQVSANGMDPFGFNFFANNKGFTDGAGNRLYRSVALAGSTVHLPDDADNATNVTHKLFFNIPAADLPSTTVSTPTGTTWMNSTPVAPVASGVSFTGLDGTPNQLGSGRGGSFTFTSASVGTYFIQVDLNGNGTYTDTTDRTLVGQAVAGTNVIFWDGNDGLGNPAPVSGSPSSITARVYVAGGEVHFPYADVETNSSGIIITRTNGNDSPTSTIFFDDTTVGGSSALPFTGQNSAGGGHTWGANGGNNNGMDTWAYYPSSTASPASPLVIKRADLEVVSKTNSASPIAGGTITYTVLFRNNGSSNVSGATLTDNFPTAVSTATFVSGTMSGTGSVSNALFNGLTFTANVSINNGETGTFIFLATISPSATGTISNLAKIVSTADVTEADDQTHIGAGNNSKTNSVLVSTLADVVTTKSGPTTASPGSTITYTILVTNNGPSAAANVLVKDTLPPGGTFVSATGSGTLGSGIVTWPTIVSLAKNGTVSFNVVLNVGGAGSITNFASSTSSTSDPSAANNNGTDPSARVTTVISAGGVSVSGQIFRDLQPNGALDGGEDWNSGTLVFVNLVQGGSVVQSASVSSGAGNFTLNNVTAGAYTLIIATSAVGTSASPPTGWGFTGPTDGSRNISVGASNMTGQNFGLFNGTGFSGRVFVDNGAGGGTANNGVQDGGETGLGGVTVKLTDSTGATVYDSAVTDGAGNYTLDIPTGLGAVTLKVTQTNISPYLSISGVAGTTGGSYDRTSDTVTFTNAPGANYTGVNFGDVPSNTFAPDNSLSALPGAVVFFTHRFTAGSVGSVNFSVTQSSSPSIPGWTQQLLVDANCNGVLDAGEPILTGPVNVAADQIVCIIVKQFVPAGAPFGAQNLVTVQASFTYAGATPPLNSAITRTDLTTVGNDTTAGLVLIKEVDKANALPGENITYTVTYKNNSSGPLSNVVIYDETPAYTTFISAGNGALPTGLTAVNITNPAVGAAGAVRWQFTGTLGAGLSGTVTYTVKVQP